MSVHGSPGDHLMTSSLLSSSLRGSSLPPSGLKVSRFGISCLKQSSLTSSWKSSSLITSKQQDEFQGRCEMFQMSLPDLAAAHQRDRDQESRRHNEGTPFEGMAFTSQVASR